MEHVCLFITLAIPFSTLHLPLFIFMIFYMFLSLIFFLFINRLTIDYNLVFFEFHPIHFSIKDQVSWKILQRPASHELYHLASLPKEESNKMALIGEKSFAMAQSHGSSFFFHRSFSINLHVMCCRINPTIYALHVNLENHIKFLFPYRNSLL